MEWNLSGMLRLLPLLLWLLALSLPRMRPSPLLLRLLPLPLVPLLRLRPLLLVKVPLLLRPRLFRLLALSLPRMRPSPLLIRLLLSILLFWFMVEDIQLGMNHLLPMWFSLIRRPSSTLIRLINPWSKFMR